MSKPVVYLYKKCSTCKNALQFLNSQLNDFVVKEITETPPTLRELKKMLSFQDGNIRKLFNTSGMLYREMGLSDKLDTLSEKEALQLLTENGMLVKRPFLLSENYGLVGFQQKTWEKTI